jgi:hypothetical protein
MLEIIVFILLFYVAASWLMGKLAKRPDGGCRGITMGCGLFLTVFAGYCLVYVLSDPHEEIMAAGVVVPWLVLGVMLITKAVKER